jgi:hypothetical protein
LRLGVPLGFLAIGLANFALLAWDLTRPASP